MNPWQCPGPASNGLSGRSPIFRQNFQPVRQALEQANNALAAESGRLKETADALETTDAQREEAERALLSLTTDHEQLKIQFGTEKNRATETEQELNAVLLQKPGPKRN